MKECVYFLFVQKEQFFSALKRQDIRNDSFPWFTFLIGNR